MACIVTLLRAGQYEIQTLASSKDFSFPKCPHWLLAHPVCYSMGNGHSFPWKHSSQDMRLTTHCQTGTKVKNKYKYTSTPPTCLCNMDRDDFTFTYYSGHLNISWRNYHVNYTSSRYFSTSCVHCVTAMQYCVNYEWLWCEGTNVCSKNKTGTFLHHSLCTVE